MDSNLILVGGVQQVDPKKIGDSTHQSGESHKEEALLYLRETTDTQSAKDQEIYKIHKRHELGGLPATEASTSTAATSWLSTHKASKDDKSSSA